MSDIEKSYSPGLATDIEKPIANPGIEPHRIRMTDKSEKHARTAEKQIAVMFGVSVVGAIIAIWGFFAFPIVDGDLAATRNNSLWMGLGMALSMFGIGFGAVHWAKTLMPDNEVSEMRHQARSSDETRAQALEIVKLADGESGFSRRKLIRRSMYGALAFFPIPAIIIFGDLGPVVGDTLKHTMWKPGTRLTKDPTGIPIKASDVTIGSVFHVIPEGLSEMEEHKLEEKAKAAVLLVRVNPSDLNEDPAKADWSYQGIVAYSKICTHVGCPVALYEQHTHHLLCPCHQSTFDLANHCEVVFGPASRPLPQLPIAVDAEGYLIAQSDFLEPVGPSFWDIRK
ncbi:putative menaquinol-cytochrome C reductase iron-sulfur subunit [Candidatus Aquiluna sp. IMCC13023]|jgi:ubiquinol-cytochrome c reductase iron-sulfur subunit|uniref:cytochrome bc1 complex Rieske iron-sulfur subunit n=1 Tax=Candidatus Aquiluna sp. IMCC13023 TaxID=1081644 RepID=UPI00025B1576|nr:Rieske 2Fe-2S domain-containing protein [Candidatus Aquiluna sp. IMCC13023]EIC91257.1 putative menaquinol-cytochrome C reductase iron-sulfur subunit [Candidatus Aquiluna sp. IMCC13023]